MFVHAQVAELYEAVWGDKGKVMSTQQMCQIFAERGDWIGQVVVVDKPSREAAGADGGSSGDRGGVEAAGVDAPL